MNMNNENGRQIIRYTYPEFLRDILLVSKQLQMPGEIDDWRPDAIFCLARGGLTMASYLAHRMGIKNAAEVDTFLGDPVPVRLIPKAWGKIHHYILVDDISDSGNTLKVAKKAIETKCAENGWKAEIKTASLWIRETTSFVPDVFARVVHGDAWIDFPWEADLRHSQMGYFLELMSFERKLYNPSRYIAIMPMKDADVEAGKAPHIAITDVPEMASVFEDVAEVNIVLEELRTHMHDHPELQGLGTLIVSSGAYNQEQHAKYWRTFRIKD